MREIPRTMQHLPLVDGHRVDNALSNIGLQDAETAEHAPNGQRTAGGIHVGTSVVDDVGGKRE